MLKIKDEGIILEKTNLEFENKSVWNPACIQVGGITHMFYRATNHNDISSIGYCQLKDNKVVRRLKEPILFPEYDYEKKGVEDPRITFLEGTYYLFYTAFDGRNARIAYATSNNLVNFVKKGLLSPNITYEKASEIFRQKNLKEEYFISKLHLETKFKGLNFIWDKDALLFPKKINNQFALNHRIRPDIQIIYFQNFKDLTDDYWETYLKELKKYILLEPKFQFENQYIGGGCPPIETKDGWLIIYHGVENTSFGKIYHACAALLDLKNPLKVLGRLRKPLFSPKASWEKSGITDNVVFPTGVVVRDGRLHIYYGAADELIAAKSINLTELLIELKKSP
jgi:beta-1,2-mannobiose phosphorylase / 1,2-beta-oligomannan phosphorylase